jgi:hypothetical protein
MTRRFSLGTDRPIRETLDDRTTAYVLETQRPFQDLREVASQLAGVLVLAASAAAVTFDHPVMQAARETLDQAADTIRRARPSERARAHHASLIAAAGLLEDALRMASSVRRGGTAVGVEAVLVPLKSSYQQLQEASGRLPGFELVSFEQGCCRK